MNAHSVYPFIKEFYPQYDGVQTYPADQCAVFCEARNEWGVLGNMASTPIIVKGVTFKSAEHLFQMMKFTEPDIVRRIWNGITREGKHSNSIKMTAKSYEVAHRRVDWGSMVVDALRFAMQQKYEQCEAFRLELERSRGLYIVEKQANPKKAADTWSAKLVGDQWIGPNLTGRLLMELRENGCLEAKLPPNALDFVQFCKVEIAK